MKRTLLSYRKFLVNNPVVTIVLACISIFIIWSRYREGKLLLGVGYLSAVGLSVMVLDLLMVLSRYENAPPFPVRAPRKETVYIVICSLIGLGWLVLRFWPGNIWENLPGIARLLLLPGLLFSFPIALAVIFLLLGYRPHELGLRFRGIVFSIPIILLFGTISFIVAPENMRWTKMVHEEGIVNLIFTGFVAAALSEEFLRMLAQSRFGVIMKSKAGGWLAASLLWAILHTPKFYSDSNNISEAIEGSISIIPLGLLWGYITHRTGSILPSVLVHGTNLWGLQNF